MPALRTVTLGCKVNQYETELVRQALLGAGYRDAQPDETAELCIVNTCTVTHEADAKSRQTIRQLARRNPAARIVVMGCYATRAPEEVAQLPGVVEVVTDKRELPDLLGRFGVADVPSGLVTFGGHQRAWVKVQDGCLLRCSFCIIPQVRPHVASRPLEHIRQEVRRLIDGGYREIVLTGIHLGHYGVEWNRGRPKHQWTRLAHLVEALAALPGEFRLRLSSIEATEVTRELLAVMAAHPDKVCPHLHISMQSGSDAVLRRMRRRWGAKRLIDRCLLARETLDQPALSTDVIVGFPGETEEDFEATCRAVREVGFMKIHVFPFSARRGTAAATMPDQIPPAVKDARARHLDHLAREMRGGFLAALRGRRLQVLIESPCPDQAGRMQGTACRYVTVAVPGQASDRRRLVEVVAGEAANGRLLAERRLSSAATIRD
jgi:threonylcarbamoyladenosine tRNA methylthiotransferase MtaB